MTSGTTSGHDFWYHFQSWLPVPLSRTTSSTTSGNDFRYRTTSGNDFRYHFWEWLSVPLPVMTSGYDFWCHFWSSNFKAETSWFLFLSLSKRYYVAPNWHLKTALRHSLRPWHLTWSQKCLPRLHSLLWISKKKSMSYLITNCATSHMTSLLSHQQSFHLLGIMTYDLDPCNLWPWPTTLTFDLDLRDLDIGQPFLILGWKLEFLHFLPLWPWPLTYCRDIIVPNVCA